MISNESTIGGINYYGSATNGDPEAYYDDVCFGEGWPRSVGIENIFIMEEVNIYPNPAKDLVHINTSSDVEKIQLIGISGQQIFEQNTFGNQTSINVAEIETGIYFVRIFSPSKVITRKLVIE